MNKLYTIAFVAVITSSYASGNISSLDVEKECSVKTYGVTGVLSTAKKYNAIAQKKGLEFRRLLTLSSYI